MNIEFSLRIYLTRLFSQRQIQGVIKKYPKFIKELQKKSVLGRIGNPKDLRGIIVLLSSKSGSYINGQNICVDGGWSITWLN